ncbi:hypothetical protein HPB51_020453 [Rhipicephalus microplus]|uniref:SAP domain-containing protein n=1 Tax=Rhipicephalus microplus TaxID=6941 RepID=A0A9J6EP53_RHIMP|nr:hypothetical protein HPB51_020453 [Rhipicephalus microplus]
MAQPTGCESTELHAEEETTPREGATPRRASSRDSETTIVESVFTTLDHSRMANATKKQLVDELRARGLRCSGRKDELIARIIHDNITRQALEPRTRQRRTRLPTTTTGRRTWRRCPPTTRGFALN